MSSTIYVSDVVQNQVPAFIQEDYPQLVNFLIAYYKFLEAQGLGKRDLLQIESIRDTYNSFVLSFKNEYDVTGPTFSDVREKLLLQRIRNVFLSKGAIKTFTFLFNLMWQEQVEVKSPGQSMLIASGGNWIQDRCITVSVQAGGYANLIGKTVTRTNAAGTVSDTMVVERVVLLPNGHVRLYLSKTNIYNYAVNDIISFGVFRGIVVPNLTAPAVYSPGSGFAVGQVYQISSAGAGGCLIQITSVNSTGGILTCQIVDPGYGFTTLTNAVVTPSVAVSSVFNAYAETLSITDTGTVNLFDYVDSTYVDTSYVGAILTTFSDKTTAATVATSTNSAVITFQITPKFSFPGYFSDNSGFLSDKIFLQDNFYYQPHSYELGSNLPLSTYSDIIGTYAHPAGMQMFGKYIMTFDTQNAVTMDSNV